VRDVRALPAHVVLEAYSVLTRLPGGLAVPAGTAARVLGERFDAKPLRLADAARRSVLSTLADAGIFGGAAYDGLIGLEAVANGHTLFTLDRRAEGTYRRLGVPVTLVAT